MVVSAEVIPINIEDEMRSAYLDYSMSVIVGRALPDVRDGLKPVHRRILYAMFREGLLANKRYSKCAGVVGEVLKKYHPHGDMAVYDTLVRMAQEWNMRYPLIDGQGNFGCFTSDTRVRLADGSSRNFVELVEDYAKGVSHFTYTIKANNEIAMAPIQAPRLTKKGTPIVRVTLDNGEEIRCTPDHRFMLRDGTYCEAQYLKAGASLMPLYSRYYDGSDKDLKGYEEVYNPADDSWVFAHRVADAYNIDTKRYTRGAGRVRHHKDFNKHNNDPRNIVRMAWADHRRLHQKWVKELWNDPTFRKKMEGVLARLWKDPEFREKTIKAIGNENRRRWQSETFQAKQLAAKEKLWADLAFRKRILNAAMKKNILLHGTPEQKAAMTAKQKAWLKAMWQDAGYVIAQQERMRELSHKIWADPKHRERISALSKARMGQSKNRLIASQWSRELWKNAEYRKARSEQSAKQWQDPLYREGHQHHLANNGQKTTKSRFLTICQRAQQLPGGLTSENYERVRSESRIRGILRYEQGLSQYFADNKKLLMEEVASHHGRLNHKVVSVVPAGYADVYDLTVDGTHNFALASGVFVHNSVDGDSAAAYRYTEAKLMKMAEEMLADIDKETVDFTANFDDSTVEPVVLPTKTPNLLINGSDGIAVGMATKIPPHNLTEVIDGTIAVIENPDITIPQLMKHIPGPDFPTGASIYGGAGIKSAYETGKGIIQMRAKAMIETIARGDRESIVITEIPFQVNKAKLIEHIATLVQDGKVEGISDLRDESDRDGMRIVVELKRGTIAGVILNQLYKYTAMQSSFGVIMLSIVAGQPKVLTLKAMLERFVDHRREVVIRRTSYDLRKAEERAHILEGLKIAVENIDDVVALIKKSKSPDEAKTGLMKKYTLSEIQAQAILDLRLQRLTGLERDKIIQEYKDIQELIKDLKDILASEKRVTKIIVDELKEIRSKYGDARRTEIIAQQADEMSVEDLIQEEDMVVTISHNGYIKRNPISIYRAQRRGGRGKTGMTTGDEDFVSSLFIATTHCTMLVFSTTGKVYWLKVHEIPQIGRTAKGKAITNLINMPNTDSIAAFMTIREFSEGQNIVMATKKGVVKKTELMEYSRPRAGGIIGITLDDGDAIVSVRMTDGKQDILLSTSQGQAIRFKEEEARPIGRASRGVRGITLEKGDEVVSMETVSQKCNILSVTRNGYGKRTDSEEYRTQGRGGSGIITIKTTDRNGPVVGTMVASDTDDIMLVTDGGKVIRQHAKDISIIGRNTQGVRLINLEAGEHVVSFAKLVENDEDEASAQ